MLIQLTSAIQRYEKSGDFRTTDDLFLCMQKIARKRWGQIAQSLWARATSGVEMSELNGYLIALGYIAKPTAGGHGKYEHSTSGHSFPYSRHGKANPQFTKDVVRIIRQYIAEHPEEA